MQIIAMLTMLTDHIGSVFFPYETAWRIVGRIAFPLYIYHVVLGYRRTRNLKRYFMRLLLLCAVSQIPFMIALKPTSVNAVGTMLVSLAVIAGIDRFRGRLNAAVIVAGACVFVQVLHFDYGAYGVLLALAFRFAKGTALVALHAAINAVYLMAGWDLEAFSLVATIVLVYAPAVYRLADRIPVPRLVWRAFYPAHLAILAIAVIILKNIGIY